MLPLLAPGDTIIDGGDANYRDTPRCAAVCAGKQIQRVDPGASGGVWRLAERYSMMIAGAAHASNLTHPQPVDAALQRFQRSVLVEA